MLFADPDRLARLLNDPERPVVIIFAGKAHPHDQPGQQLIRQIHDFSMHPDFIGKILLLEGYDMALARLMVSGVDVWLNTPEYPLEASGTSGQKAGLNGAVNLSVLDGWWGEGYNGHNGWGITPRDPRFDHDQRHQEEANDLLNIIEHEMLPTYYRRDGGGYSEDWVTTVQGVDEIHHPALQCPAHAAGLRHPAVLARATTAPQAGSQRRRARPQPGRLETAGAPRLARGEHATDAAAAGTPVPRR